MPPVICSVLARVLIVMNATQKKKLDSLPRREATFMEPMECALVAKVPDGPQSKYRVNRGQELVIGGYTPSRNGLDAIIVGYYKGDGLIYGDPLAESRGATGRVESQGLFMSVSTRQRFYSRQYV
jgi:hypothetical protein